VDFRSERCRHRFSFTTVGLTCTTSGLDVGFICAEGAHKIESHSGSAQLRLTHDRRSREIKYRKSKLVDSMRVSLLNSLEKDTILSMLHVRS
jgi:hypothetical protein